MMPYFLWKNTDSRTMGLWLSQYPDRVRASERINSVSIPGRAGELVLTEGSNVYEPVRLVTRVQTVPTNDFDMLHDWLSGEGLVVFGSQPNRAWKARIQSEVAFGRISNSLLEASIQFDCEPFKRQFPAETDITMTASGSVVNIGNVEAYPVITITGSGDIVLTVNDKAFSIEDLSSKAVLDCDARMAVDNSGNNILESTDGDFPVLTVGTNTVSWTGTVTSVVITPRWRWR